MNNKKNTMVSIIAVVVLLIMLVGATYAYFEAQGGDTVTRDVNVLTHTVDTLTFNVSNDISIEADQFNFTNGGNNLSSSTTASIVLSPNSKTGSATEHYYMYLDLGNNEIEYSRENNRNIPELLLQVFDLSKQFNYWCLIFESAESEEISEEVCLVDSSQNNVLDIFGGYEYIESLEDCQYYMELLDDYIQEFPDEYPEDYIINCDQRIGYEQITLSELGESKVVNELIGYDITGIDGLIPLVFNKEIIASNNETSTNDYKVEITLLNQHFNQNDNVGKSINGNIIVSKYNLVQKYYWNNDFHEVQFTNVQIPTGNELYGTFSNLNDLKDAVNDKFLEEESEDTFDDISIYIKSIKYLNVSDQIFNHQACLYYNDNEFCLDPNYWENDSTTTKEKLKTAMEESLNTAVDICSSYSNFVKCEIDDYRCYSYNIGSVQCEIDDKICLVLSSGAAKCYEAGSR